MSPETRRAALSATARIVFATALAGCNTASPGSGTTRSSDLGTATGAAAASASAPVTVSVSAGACDTTARGGPALAAATSCCTALVGASVADGGLGLGGAAQHACCDFLAKQSDAAIVDGGSDQMHMPFRKECCSALGWTGTITCTPWGPPVPPVYEVPLEVAA